MYQLANLTLKGYSISYKLYSYNPETCCLLSSDYHPMYVSYVVLFLEQNPQILPLSYTVYIKTTSIAYVAKYIHTGAYKDHTFLIQK